MAENRAGPGAQYRAPQQRVARNRSAERCEYSAMKSLPLPGLNPSGNDVPRHPRANSLTMTQNPLLFLQYPGER